MKTQSAYFYAVWDNLGSIVTSGQKNTELEIRFATELVHELRAPRRAVGWKLDENGLSEVLCVHENLGWAEHQKP